VPPTETTSPPTDPPRRGSSRPVRGDEAGEVHLAEHEEQLGRPP
jgi:hypothetical protein